MSELPEGRRNGQAEEHILVAVRDEGQERRGQGSLIDDRRRAERIVAALIEAGVEEQAVSALRARELPLRVTYRWVVELVDERDEAPKASGEPGPAAEWTRGLLTKAARFLEEVTPDSPFQLRMDRVVWLGLWAGSLLILAMSLMTSLSRGAAREFVVEAPSTSFEFGAEGEAMPAAVAGVTQLPECMGGVFNNCRCGDFATQLEAQTFFESYPAGPGHNVDPDGDGTVCEWLPPSTPSPSS